jgi:hypothetical protein
MIKGTPGYISEHVVTLHSSAVLFIAADQLMSDGEMSPEDQEVSKNSHIYLICQRPSLAFDPTNFDYVDGFIVGNLVYRVNGVESKVSFKQEFPLKDGAVEVRLSKYPHREVQTFDGLANAVRILPASYLGHKLAWMHSLTDLSQLKVLYVGQSFASGNRTAIERLRNHGTFQKILAETSYEAPDCEIFLATVRYDHYGLMTSMDGRDKNAISDERDSKRLKNIIDNPLKMGQQISLAEASLIRYFQPRYNEKFKTKFPSRNVKVLADCFKLDFSGLIVELDTTDSPFSLFSDTVAPSQHHSSQISLVNQSERRGFFQISGGTGELRPMLPDIIELTN